MQNDKHRQTSWTHFIYYRFNIIYFYNILKITIIWFLGRLIRQGVSRGIGKAIAIKAPRDGANIVIAARTTEENPKLPGTIYTAAHEVEKAGGRDIRDEEQVRAAVHDAVSRFGGIDIVVNNASAISFSSTPATKIKHFDTMYQPNTRGAFIVSQECLPYLIRSEYSHILNIAPPLNLDPKWFSAYLGYTIAKYGMSMCVLGMAY